MRLRRALQFHALGDEELLRAGLSCLVQVQLRSLFRTSLRVKMPPKPEGALTVSVGELRM